MLALHSSDIIHMDIKPANILLEFSGADVIAKLADFGISKSLDPSSTFAGSTTGNSCGGSLMWMAPELIQRPPLPSPASDVYAFGMVMYEMFTGCKPWEAELHASNLSPVMIPAWVISGSRPSIPAHLPQPVASLIQRCWHALPTARPVVSDIIDAISQLIERDCHLFSPHSFPPSHTHDPASVLSPSSVASVVSASLDVVEDELQGMVSEMMQLKMGVKAACVASARLLADEGVMSLEELRPLSSAKASALLPKSGLKEMQIDKVIRAYCPLQSLPPPQSPASPPSVSLSTSSSTADSFHPRYDHATAKRGDSSSPPPASSFFSSSRVLLITLYLSAAFSCSILTQQFQGVPSHLAGKPDIIKAVESGDVRLVEAYLAADTSCINQHDREWVPPRHNSSGFIVNVCICVQLFICVLPVDGLLSIILLTITNPKYAVCSSITKLT